MRRVVTGLRNLHNARSLDAVALSPLGSRIPLVSLIHALAVAEHLNFRHAAFTLGVSQSSASTRIKQLEQDLGTPLFERRHRGVRLTRDWIGSDNFDVARKVGEATANVVHERILSGQ